MCCHIHADNQWIKYQCSVGGNSYQPRVCCSEQAFHLTTLAENREQQYPLRDRALVVWNISAQASLAASNTKQGWYWICARNKASQGEYMQGRKNTILETFYLTMILPLYCKINFRARKEIIYINTEGSQAHFFMNLVSPNTVLDAIYFFSC